MNEVKEVKINTEYITLGQLLKMENIVGSGGMVKMFLGENTVYVNNELENRRGKKLYNDYIINIENYGKFKIKSN